MASLPVNYQAAAAPSSRYSHSSKQSHQGNGAVKGTTAYGASSSTAAGTSLTRKKSVSTVTQAEKQ